MKQLIVFLARLFASTLQVFLVQNGRTDLVEGQKYSLQRTYSFFCSSLRQKWSGWLPEDNKISAQQENNPDWGRDIGV